ncbi:MAG: hypothetical protein ACL93V_16700 [Candidatus Electrothrix sp. YB6]
MTVPAQHLIPAALRAFGTKRWTRNFPAIINRKRPLYQENSGQLGILLLKMKKRLSKKNHKEWLEYGVIDASQNSYWRQKLFESEKYESFQIDKDHLEGILPEVARAIKRYDLYYLASKVSADEAEPWLSEGGLIIFKFWAKHHPSVKMFSGNSPEVI